MARKLGKHTKTKEGRFREERSDSKAKNLAVDYPEFKRVRPEMTFGQVKARLGTANMAATRAALRKISKL